MKGVYFHGLFYNEAGDMESFAPSSPPSPLASLPAAVVVPHAELGLARGLISEALGHAASLGPDLIAILAPLHSPLPERDKGAAAYTTPLTEAEGEVFKVEFAKLPLPFVAERLQPFQDEPSCEILYPPLAKVFPGVPILPLLAAEGVSKLRRIVSRIILSKPRTLFVLSCNAVGSDLALGQTDLAHEKGLCARFWAEALGGRWEITALSRTEDTTHFAGRRLA